ncbi:hypothetical protein CAC42_6169 [Sphaceloma murrayae]|uniref:SH3 domain-containing protein n=1 Tax=Sphaceloma murrayae TaxID=2082308 RepID=A0A2K1QTF7_9PEZI|nr:hypothetical protein CAC42_6169 [Sphaceloma murrayae]
MVKSTTKRRMYDDAVTLQISHTTETEVKSSQRRRKRRRRKHSHFATAAALLLASIPSASAQSCISLSQSSQCPAFNASSISTDAFTVGLFPFLSTVTDTASFDREIQSYISGTFIQLRFQQLIGCGNFDAQNPTAYYARYTTSVLCNAIVQNSINGCGLSGRSATPLCADTCALYAQGEQSIASSAACGGQGPNGESQIRSDLTNCALPARSLEGSCIPGTQNEPQSCGFAANLAGLCSYCSAASPNATDSCCVFSDTERRCQGVNLAVAAATSASASPSPTATGSSPPAGQNNQIPRSGLSPGQIAGIVVGCVLGGLVLVALIVLSCLVVRKRRKQSPPTSVFNQPVQTRERPQMAQHDGPAIGSTREVEALPGGRVTRMAALEGRRSGEVKPQYDSSGGETPTRTPVGPPPRRKRSVNGLAMGMGIGMDTSDESSPSNGMSSPEGTGQSEQLAFFKDYYSAEEVRPGDVVATLWAYQPRAQDEFELERGDMLKVVGIWDDGWATGIRVETRAEEWAEGATRAGLRDSGMSEGGAATATATATAAAAAAAAGSGDRDAVGSSGEEDSSGHDAGGEASGGQVKAFPLVCVCLPQYWRRTIEGETGSEGETTESP